MGAGASMSTVYTDALEWFKEYFSTETYVEDFKSIDKDQDGGITDAELMRWIKLKKQNEGGSWRAIVENKDVFRIAHQQTVHSARYPMTMTDKGLKTFTIVAFRSFLLHTYAISILWAHFKHADENGSTADAGDRRLSRDEFEHAVRTLCCARQGEEVTPQQLRVDFDVLDINKDNYVVFHEVCAYCCRYIDATHSGILNSVPYDELNDIGSKRFTNSNSSSSEGIASDLTNAAVEAMQDSISRESMKISHACMKISTSQEVRSSLDEHATRSELLEQEYPPEYDTNVSLPLESDVSSKKRSHESAKQTTDLALRASYDFHAVEGMDGAHGNEAALLVGIARVSSMDHHHGEDFLPLHLSPRIVSGDASPRLPCFTPRATSTGMDGEWVPEPASCAGAAHHPADSVAGRDDGDLPPPQQSPRSTAMEGTSAINTTSAIVA